MLEIAGESLIALATERIRFGLDPPFMRPELGQINLMNTILYMNFGL
jgi:hypothetical protein